MVLIIMALMLIQAVSNLIMDWRNMDDDLVVENEFLAEIEELKRANKIAEEKELANKKLREKG